MKNSTANYMRLEDTVAFEASQELGKITEHPLLAQIDACLRHGLVPMLEGQPGVAKSSLVYQYAERHGLDIMEFRPSLEDLSGIKGLPSFVTKDGLTLTQWAVPSHFPIDPDWQGILFLDEVVKAAPSMQGALSQLVLDRRVGDYYLPKGARIIMAGNRTKDRAAAFKMPTDLADRVARLQVEFHLDAWTSWAKTEGLPPVAVAFANFRAGLLSQFDPAIEVNCTPRSFTDASKLLDEAEDVAVAVMTGIIGEGPTVELIGFKRNWEAVPSLPAVLDRGDRLPVPEEPSVAYATLMKLAESVTGDNVEKLFVYIGRFSVEYQTVFWKAALAKSTKLLASPVFGVWIDKHEGLLRA